MDRVYLGMLLGVILTTAFVEGAIAFAPRIMLDRTCTVTVSDRAGHLHEIEGTY